VIASGGVAQDPRRRSRPPRGAPAGDRPYHHGDLRQAVLDEALALIDERGHADFTLREIARRVGVSHAAPYRHFPDRRALITELAAMAGEDLGARVEAALDAAGDDLRARFLSAGFAYVRFALDHPASFRAMLSADVDPEHPRMIAAKERSYGLLLRFVRDAQERGAFPAGDPAEIATAVWAMHHGLASLAALGALSKQGPKGLRRAVDAAHTRLLDGLLQRPAAPASPRATRR
jgi:AcrR family transcriptional regulator